MLLFLSFPLLPPFDPPRETDESIPRLRRDSLPSLFPKIFNPPIDKPKKMFILRSTIAVYAQRKWFNQLLPPLFALFDPISSPPIDISGCKSMLSKFPLLFCLSPPVLSRFEPSVRTLIFKRPGVI